MLFLFLDQFAKESTKKNDTRACCPGSFFIVYFEFMVAGAVRGPDRLAVVPRPWHSCQAKANPVTYQSAFLAPDIIDNLC